VNGQALKHDRRYDCILFASNIHLYYCIACCFLLLASIFQHKIFTHLFYYFYKLFFIFEIFFILFSFAMYSKFVLRW